MKTFEQWYAELPDPDNMGQSEYRMLYEFITDIADDLEAHPSEDPIEAVRVVLRQVIEHARSIEKTLPQVHTLTVREINSLVRQERYVQARDDSPNPPFRIVAARTVKGQLQGRSLADGRWYAIHEAWEV